MTGLQARYRLATFAIAAGSIACGHSQTTDSMDQQFNDISERYIEALLTASPVSATDLGDHRFDHLLDEVDQSARENEVQSSRALLAELEELEFDQLNREHQVDLSLLRQRLAKQIWEIEDLREWQWNPLIYINVAGSSLYGLLARDGLPIEQRLKSAAARCRAFPRFFEQARQSLSIELTPPIHAETAVDQNRGLLKLLDGLLVPSLENLACEPRTELESAIAIARSAIDEQQRWLESELLAGAAGQARLSRERYHEKFSFDLFSSFSPEDLRQRAEQQLKDIHKRMFELSKSILGGAGTDFEDPQESDSEGRKKVIRAALELAYAEAPSRDGVVESAYHSLELTTDFVREKDLITLPDDPLEIILMPEFQRGVALAYCDAPGPLEEGGKTFYAVAPPPDDWSDQQVNSFLREYNLRSLHNLTVHEAMPGHYVQLAHANRVSSELRAVLASGTFIEGWAVYTERMMVDEGFLPDDLLMRLIVLKWNLRGVVNALLDQLIHLDDIDENAAMKLLVDEAFQEEREAAGKYRRAQLTSVQLSTYFAGYMEVVELKAEVEETWGDSFDLKTFHDKLLSFGSPPTAYVRALLLELPIPHPSH